MKPLKWEQVLAYRVRRNHLSARAHKNDLANVVADMCGVHAQLLPAAELSLWARVQGIKQGGLRKPLFEDRTLFRTWSMRGTLHLLPSSQFKMYIGALKTRTGYRKGAWLNYFGVSLEEIDRIIASIGKALGKSPLTKKELAEEVSRSEGEHLRKELLSGWGELLKPAAYNGLLARGPDRDGEATYVRADRWLGIKTNRDPNDSMKDVLRHYLRSYGPAKHEDFARWWGTQPAPSKRLFRSVEDELVQVDVEGFSAWMLKEDLEVLEGVRPEQHVRLLPNFDAYVVGFRPRDFLVGKDRAGLVFRPQAWISPVLLVNGKIAGVWERTTSKNEDALQIRLFRSLTESQRKALSDEIERMSDYFGSRITATSSPMPA